MALASRFCVLWMRNTIRNVTMVVLVLMTSCQVSLKPKRGPVMAHVRMMAAAMRKAAGRPVACAVHFASRVKRDFGLVGRIRSVRHRVQQHVDAKRVSVRREL